MEVIIERAKIQELPKVKELLSRTWKDTYTFLRPETIEKFTSTWHKLEILQQQAQNPDIVFAVAKVAGAIAGLITATRSQEDNNIILISRLYVSPDYQRQGIGRKLLDYVIAAFPNATALQLEVEDQNKKGVAFYEKQGFTLLKMRDEEFEGEILSNRVMKKKL